jgi:glycosyltransferase involved in cell wall biosynthesis
MKISIVIPTYNHLEDCLKPCIETLKEYTDLTNIEVIVVANGCIDGTKLFVLGLGKPFKLLWYDEPKGYTFATNRGIETALQDGADYVILLNNDVFLTPQPKNQWINWLVEPFLKYEDMGVTGSLILSDMYTAREFIVFSCAMISRKCFEKIGILHEDYGIGGGEDIDFCIRAQDAGFKTIHVPEGSKIIYDVMNITEFPIHHVGEATMHDNPEWGPILKKNFFVNMFKYNKHVKLNLGSGGVHLYGFFSVDLYDKRAHLKLDVTDLSIFPDNFVEEIVASHVIEHINPYKVVDTLRGWHRILKPGCKLALELPNIERICRAFIDADKGARYGLLNCIYGSVNTEATDDPTHITAPHLFGWYEEILVDHLWMAGFDPNKIIFMDEQIPHPMGQINFRCEAIK